MDPYGKNELLSFYDRHLRDFGDHHQAVRWTEAGQLRRYEAFLEITGDLRGKTLLDFGCGKGDLYAFLQKKKISVTYCGIDVNENLINLAKKKFPEPDFLAMDIEETDLDRYFDIIFVCGVFNLRIAGIEETMYNILKNLFQSCKEALHVSVLSWYRPQRNVELFYARPEVLLKFALTELSDKVVLRNNIVKDDIFLSVYR